ncbi:MAG: UDP-N-acetyl-D-mannosamine dehydrogenase [Thermoplasmatota archaeon]
MNEDTRPDVCVVGLGYIGLPTAVVLAESGLSVLGVDIRRDIVEGVNRGEALFDEEGLADRLRGVVRSGRLTADLKPHPSKAFIIAVPTPVTPERRADMHYVWSAAESVASELRAGDLIVLESTSPVGSTEELVRRIARHRPDLARPAPGPGVAVQVAYCPERIIPGNMFHELVNNDRIVGGVDDESTARAVRLYARFVKGAIHRGTSRLAETCKLAENAFRDVNIAYANELSMLCERLGVDVWELIRVANRHPRVNILNPGPGVGGHCIPVDPWFLVEAAPELTPLLRTAREVNLAKMHHVLEQARALAAEHPRVRIAILGLAYKPNTNDLRESPALEIALALAREGKHDLLVVEPGLTKLPQELASLPRIHLVPLEDALAKAGLIVVLTGHAAFRGVSPKALSGKAVIDAPGLWVD